MVVDRPPSLDLVVVLAFAVRVRVVAARARVCVVPSGIVFASASRRMPSIPAARKRRANHASMSNLRRSIGRTSPPAPPPPRGSATAAGWSFRGVDPPGLRRTTRTERRFRAAGETKTGYYPPTPSVAGPARAPRDLSRDRARACARTRRGTISRPRVRADRSRRTAAARVSSAPAVNTTVSANSATASRNLAKPGRTNTTTATAAEEPSGGVAPDPPKPFSGFSGFSGSAPSAPEGSAIPPGASFVRPGSPSPRTRSRAEARRRGRAPRTTTKTPARTFGASPRREVPRDATGPRRRCTRTRASRPNPKPRTARRVSPAAAAGEARGTIGTRSGGGIVHPSANRAISGGGEGRSGRALRVVDGTERRGGVLSAGDGVDDGRGARFRRAPGRAGAGAGGGARARRATVRRARESPNARRGGVRGRRTIRRGPRSIVGRTREAGTPSRRGSATTGEGRRASVNSHLGRDTAGGDGATRSSRGTFFAAGSGGSRARASAESALTDARHTTPPGDRFDARASIGARMACAWTREAAREPRSTRVGGMFLRRVPRRRKRAERMRGGPRRTWISSRADVRFRVSARSRAHETFANLRDRASVPAGAARPRSETRTLAFRQLTEQALKFGICWFGSVGRIVTSRRSE